MMIAPIYLWCHLKMTSPHEMEGCPKLATKSNNRRKGLLQKVKLLNYQKRHGAKKGPCSTKLLEEGSGSGRLQLSIDPLPRVLSTYQHYFLNHQCYFRNFELKFIPLQAIFLLFKTKYMGIVSLFCVSLVYWNSYISCIYLYSHLM